MTQKGLHTWDLILDYYRCPKCGFVIESRVDYVPNHDKKVKNLVCSRCGHTFTLTKNPKEGFGPIIGDPQPPEIDWE